MQILSSEQMRDADRRTIDGRGIPGLRLMESAGRAVARNLLADYPDALERGLLVLCGKGNNGGDGLVAARHLARRGPLPRIALLAATNELTGDAATNLSLARGAGLTVVEIDPTDLSVCARMIDRAGVVLDALLGTGIRGGARGAVAQVIELLNDRGLPVVSVDLPSGVDGDSGAIEGAVVKAERTYTLCRPKPSLVVEPAARNAGRWRVLDIGIPEDVVAHSGADLEWIDADAAAALLPRRPVDTHKGHCGHLLAVAGSTAMSGAAVLLARGALRCGVGLITVATGASARRRIAVQQPEIMTHGLEQARDGTLAAGAAARALTLSADRDALAIGPGLGGSDTVRAAVVELLAARSVPTVLDADGLNAIAASGGLESLRSNPAALVLTPHPGEAARLLGCDTDRIQADRFDAARRIAEASGAVVVLKGHLTLVASPGGALSVNGSGNPGLATAGTGDVLCGAIGAFLARGLSPEASARLAVYVHGDAGDRVACRIGVDGLIASDVISELPASLRALSEGRD